MSGTATWAQIISRLQAFANADRTTRAFAQDQMLALFEAIEADNVGDYGPSGNPAYTNGHRGLLSECLSPGLLQSGLVPMMLDAGVTKGSPATAEDVDRLRRDFFEFMRTDGTLNRVLTRAITFGAPPAFTPTGDGVPYRLTVDEFGFDLEAVTAEQKTLICREDQVSGSRRGAELFELHGVAPSQDFINKFVQGSGIINPTRVRHAGSGDGGSLLVNSSFDEPIVAGGAANKVPGWEIPNGDPNISQNFDTAFIFTAPPGIADVNSASLNAVGDFKMVQSIEDAGFTAEVTTPYFLSMQYRPNNGCDGVLTLRMGSVTVAVADLTLAPAGVWSEILIPLDQNVWPSNFYEDRMDIEIELSGHTIGDLDIDTLVFTAIDFIDGSYYLIRGGQTPFELDDKSVFSDAAANVATIQEMWVAAGFGYLPHDPAPTIPDPV